MAASIKLMAVAMVVAIIFSASLLGETDAAIVVKNQSRATNVSVTDITMGLTIGNLGPTQSGTFSDLSPLNHDLFKIVNLMNNEPVTKQFFGTNATVTVLDDGLGDVSVLVELASSSA